MSRIKAKEYHWRQTNDTVLIYIYLIYQQKNINFFITSNYLKAVCKPASLLLEVFLCEEIICEESFCVLNDTEVTFSLKKKNISIEWPTLEKINLDKKSILELRQQQCEQMQHRSQLTSKNKKEKNEYRKKEAVRAQITLIESMNNKIDKTVTQLKNEATLIIEECDEMSDTFNGESIPEKKNEKKISRNEITKLDKQCLPIANAKNNENKNESKMKERLKANFMKPETSIPLRKPAVIPVSFTDRAFQTPARESYSAEEYEWMTKQSKIKEEIRKKKENIQNE